MMDSKHGIIDVEDASLELVPMKCPGRRDHCHVDVISSAGLYAMFALEGLTQEKRGGESIKKGRLLSGPSPALRKEAFPLE